VGPGDTEGVGEVPGTGLPDGSEPDGFCDAAVGDGDRGDPNDPGAVEPPTSEGGKLAPEKPISASTTARPMVASTIAAAVSPIASRRLGSIS
jgi:hypothetical protein